MAPAEDIPPLQRTSTPTLKHRSPSLPIDSADPLNALPPHTNDSTLSSLAGALEASYKLFWSKVQLVEPPRTLEDVRKLISRPFTEDPTTTKEPTNISKLIVGSGAVDHKPDDQGRGNLMYLFPLVLQVTCV